MGSAFINWYKNKLKYKYKIAFSSTFIIGLLVHIYKFTNTLLNHDSIFNFYSDQNVLGSGRWFLSVACGFSSYFDLPWINGLLSIFFIALTAVIIVNVLEIENVFLVILTGSILVTFPAVTETFQFGFTADGYMMAMLFAALTVYFSKISKNKLSFSLITIVLLCLVCGIYQAYFSFALVLVLIYFVLQLLKNQYAKKQYLLYVVRQVIIFLIALILYFVVWKICLSFQQTEANEYQGISNLGVNLSTIFLSFKTTIKNILVYCFGKNPLKYGITLYGIINALIVVLFVFSVVICIYKSEIYKSKLSLALLIISILLLPFAIFMWQFTSPTLQYGIRMEQSISLLIVFAAIVIDKYCSVRISNVVAIILVIFIFNNSINANIGYFLLEQSNKRTYATGLQMVNSINEKASSNNDIDTVTFIGNKLDEVELSVGFASEKYLNGNYYLGLIETDMIYDGAHAYLYISNTFDFDYKKATQEETADIESTPEYKSMGVWPAEDSVAVINDTVVVKLSESND